MKRYTITVTYSLTIAHTTDVEIEDDQDASEALSLAAQKAPVPNNSNLNEFTVIDFEQYELTDQDILDVEEDCGDENCFECN